MSLKAPQNRVLNLFKMVRGKKVPYTVVIDENQVILSEGFANRKEPAVGETKPSADVIFAQRKADLDARGIGYEEHISPDGRTRSLTLTHLPLRQQKLMQFFVSSAPCPKFPGATQLRLEYRKELDLLESDCPTKCDKGKLNRKYQEIMEKLTEGIKDEDL